jgi:hypothetical protein
MNAGGRSDARLPAALSRLEVEFFEVGPDDRRRYAAADVKRLVSVRHALVPLLEELDVGLEVIRSDRRVVRQDGPEGRSVLEELRLVLRRRLVGLDLRKNGL